MLSIGSHISPNIDTQEFISLAAKDKLLVWLRNSRQFNGGANASCSESEWVDVSGHNNHAVMEDEAAQAEASLGGLHFDGSSSYMDFTTKMEIGQETGFAIFTVMTLDANTNEVWLSDSANEFIEMQTSSKIRIKTTGTGSGNITSVFTSGSGAMFGTGNAMLITITRTAAGELKVYKDGVEAAGTISNNPNAGAIDIFNLGCRNDADRFFDGIMHELVFYEAALSGDDLSNVHSYLNSKFGLS